MEKKVRQSNIELARNISMFMILMLHANYVALGYPSGDDLASSPMSTIIRCFFEALSISSVNVFVFISGWFGIHPSAKSVLKFVYQILFFLGIGFIVTLTLGITNFSLSAVADVFQLSTTDWFIKSYFVLMILSPLLNLFVTQLDIKMQRIILIAFFAFEFVYGWAGGGVRFFVSGYGPLHLIGIYLLGQYLHFSLQDEKENVSLFYHLFTMKPAYDMLIFFLCTICTTVLQLAAIKMTGRVMYAYTIAYSSPFVIGGGCFFIFVFHKVEVIIRSHYQLAWCK